MYLFQDQYKPQAVSGLLFFHTVFFCLFLNPKQYLIKNRALVKITLLIR